MVYDQSSDVLRVSCPACHDTCLVRGPDSTCEIHCEACGTSFSLVPENTKTEVAMTRDMIGQFQLVDHLGSGSFGDVWLANDTILDRQVALKVARPDRFDPSDGDRFFREARAAAQLKHHNIVSVHEVGRDGDRLFIVSDFIRGATLADHISSRVFTTRNAAELCATISDGLHHAHEAGVIHRDLKPQNIILDLAGVPHIADFGLAKRETGEVTITLDGNIVGTPSYMSPEQAHGESHSVDRRSDIYSLGVILYRLLTGEMPFRGNYRMLLVQIINDPPPPPRRLESKIPRDLETICLKCLEKRPEHRYETAAELGDDLRRWLGSKPILASPPGVVGRLLRWSQRKPALASLTAILLAVTIAGISAFAWQYDKTVKAHHALMVSQVEGLQTATAEQTRVLLKNIASFGEMVVPNLRQARHDDTLTESQRIRYSLALLPHDSREVEYLFQQIPSCDVDELQLIREALAPYAERFTPQLWKSVNSADTDAATQLRFAGTLAELDPRSDLWESIAPDVGASLAALDRLEFSRWLKVFAPAKEGLLPQFQSLFAEHEDERIREVTAHLMVRFLEDDPEALVALLPMCNIKQLKIVIVALQRSGQATLARVELNSQMPVHLESGSQVTICNAVIALAQLGEDKPLWRLLGSNVSSDISVHLIHMLAPSGVRAEVLAERLSDEESPAVRRAILLALGEYDKYGEYGEIGENEVLHTTSQFRESVGTRVRELHAQDSDAGVHSAAAWLMRKWRIDQDAVAQAPPGASWMVDESGQTLLVVGSGKKYTMGSPLDEESRSKSEELREVTIPYSFAIATTEVTLAQFEEFLRANEWSSFDLKHNKSIGPTGDSPVNNLGLNEIAAYCRWLSHVAGMKEDEMCYPPIKKLGESKLVAPYPDYLQRPGYRLITDVEWEYACRAGCRLARFTGSSPEMLEKYACYRANSDGRTRPVGMFKPNRLGLFDVYGNLSEVVLYAGPYAKSGSKNRQVVQLRGGSFQEGYERIRSAARLPAYATSRSPRNGYRVARTLP